MKLAKPNDEHTVNAAAPILTNAIVLTPALCFANDRSFPNTAPKSAAYSSRRHNLASVMPETGLAAVGTNAAPAVDDTAAALTTFALACCTAGPNDKRHTIKMVAAIDIWTFLIKR